MYKRQEGILTGAAKEILGTYHIQWLGHDVDLTPSWKRITMADAVQNVTGADFMAIEGDDDAAVELAAQCGVSAPELMEMLRILLKEEEPHV